MSRRVVVTGVGCITPLGTEIQQVWDNLAEGRSGVGPITAFDAAQFPIRIAAEVRDWSIAQVGEDPARWRKHPRQNHFAVGAAHNAMRSAALNTARLDPRRFGVYLGCGETFPDLDVVGPGNLPVARHRRLSPIRSSISGRSPRWIPRCAAYCEPHVPAQCLAGLFGAEGPNLNCIAACTSSTQAIGGAAELIRRGEVDVMIAGGSHSMIHPVAISGLHRLSVLTCANEKMAKAMRPFDAHRDGFVVGEGGAVVDSRGADHALTRGAEIWGEVTGYASSHEAFHLTDTRPDGRSLVQCVHDSLAQAELNPDQIDYINAHGTSTRMNDRIETGAQTGVRRGGVPDSHFQHQEHARPQHHRMRRDRVCRGADGGADRRHSADDQLRNRRSRSAISTTFPTPPGSATAATRCPTASGSAAKARR